MSKAFRELRDALRDFAAERDWEQFHSPRNLATALAVEAAELLLDRGALVAMDAICYHFGASLEDAADIEDFAEHRCIVCPWHNYKYHRVKGHGEPGFEEDQVPLHDLKEEGGHLFVTATPTVNRHKPAHEVHSLERKLERAPGPVRGLGISTTNMDR